MQFERTELKLAERSKKEKQKERQACEYGVLTTEIRFV